MRLRALLPAGLLTFAACCLFLLANPSAANGRTVSQDNAVPVEAIHDSARQVMDQSDFRSVRRRVLEKIPAHEADNGFLEGLIESIASGISDFFSWLFTPSRPKRPRSTPTSPGSAPSSGGDFDFARALTIVLVLALAGLAIWFIAGAIRRHQQDPERGSIPSISETALELATPPGELAASTYESRAIQLAQQGNFSAAIRELLLGSMSWIERAGLIRFRKGLTNRDYVRAVWRQEDRRAAYVVTGTEFELVFFGRRTATSAMFQRCLTAFQGAFCEEAAIARDEG